MIYRECQLYATVYTLDIILKNYESIKEYVTIRCVF